MLDRLQLAYIASVGSNRLVSQLRVMRTERFVPRADIVAQVRRRVEVDPFFARLRAVADPAAFTAIEDADFDVAEHVRETRGDPALARDGEDPFEAAVNAMMCRELPEQRMWELETFTDGVDSHGVVLRWNHWIGDGLSTQMCLSRLFDYPFEIDPTVQSRSADSAEATFFGKLKYGWWLQKALRRPTQETWFTAGCKKEEVPQVMLDGSKMIAMPPSDFHAVRRAAKAQKTTVTALLVSAASKTYLELLRRFCTSPPFERLIVMGSVARRRGDELANNSAVTAMVFPTAATTPQIAAEYRRAVDECVEMGPPGNALIEWMERRWGTLKVLEGLILPMLTKPKKPFHLVVTTFPGPKQQFGICGVPVTGMYNCMGHGSHPIFTCCGYNGKLFVTLGTMDRVHLKQDVVKAVWAEQLDAVLAS